MDAELKALLESSDAGRELLARLDRAEKERGEARAVALYREHAIVHALDRRSLYCSHDGAHHEEAMPGRSWGCCRLVKELRDALSPEPIPMYFSLDAMRSDLTAARARVAELEGGVTPPDECHHPVKCSSIRLCAVNALSLRTNMPEVVNEFYRDARVGWISPEVVAKVREELKKVEQSYIHGDECGGNPEGLTHDELDCGHSCLQCGAGDNDECPMHDEAACFLAHCDCSIGPALRALALLAPEARWTQEELDRAKERGAETMREWSRKEGGGA